jgi:hypothetical protein
MFKEVKMPIDNMIGLMREYATRDIADINLNDLKTSHSPECGGGYGQELTSKAALAQDFGQKFNHLKTIIENNRNNPNFPDLSAILRVMKQTKESAEEDFKRTYEHHTGLTALTMVPGGIIDRIPEQNKFNYMSTISRPTYSALTQEV